jgi:hypothetical protein
VAIPHSVAVAWEIKLVVKIPSLGVRHGEVGVILINLTNGSDG